MRSKTVVIVGAGASYDCVLVEPHLIARPHGEAFEVRRPPLTTGLVADTPFTRTHMQSHAGSEIVADWLAAEMHRDADSGLETHLARYVDASADPESARQRLQGFARYVRDLITASSNFVTNTEVGGMRTAYTRLARLIEELTGTAGPVLLVNFNYDSLLDQMVTRVLGDRVSFVAETAAPGRRIRLAKPHGCVVWCGEVADDPSTWTYGGSRLDPPAIALPVANKDQWVCPDSHVEAISDADPERIIIVGWRAADPLVLEKLAEGRTSNDPVALDIVTMGDESVTEILRHLHDAPIQFRSPRALTRGFADAVRQHHLDSLILDPSWAPPT